MLCLFFPRNNFFSFLFLKASIQVFTAMIRYIQVENADFSSNFVNSIYFYKKFLAKHLLLLLHFCIIRYAIWYTKLSFSFTNFFPRSFIILFCCTQPFGLFFFFLHSFAAPFILFFLSQNYHKNVSLCT